MDNDPLSMLIAPYGIDLSGPAGRTVLYEFGAGPLFFLLQIQSL
jgi:hypothetical protein